MTQDEILRAIEKGRFFPVTGTNTYVGTSSASFPKVKSYSARRSFYLLIGSTNTGASTLNIDGVGAGNIYKFGNQPVAAGDLPANNIVEVVYDGTNFQAVGGGIIFAFINQRINSAASNFSQTII
ncbi:MAG: hypothetical protein V4594_16675 [Bacteroidota bacterium]